ncbi:hypothetical protein [Marinobacter salarius]|uniref:Uncharacterized protein n=1 Tax=Marinobacter salarius TaxID=1420917 RepID=A0A1W6K9L3_9GAMM|nr:hypothetical protein [Marinobacter salarius]ARM83999.1 hypothetical protein MARSALSMR5_01921 [Marinobacter salarius]
MGSTVTDRITGLSTSVAIKAPVQAITQGDITLYGLGVQAGGGWVGSLVAGNRVLVKDQSNAVENGIYIAHATGWRRARDFNGYRDAVQGTAVPLASTGDRYRVVTEDPIIIGSSEIEFQLHPNDARVIPVTSRATMKTYDVPVGYQFSLEEGGRSGTFVVKSGTPPSDPQEGIYVGLGNGNYAERVWEGAAYVEWFGADPSVDDNTAAYDGATSVLADGALIRWSGAGENYTGNFTSESKSFRCDLNGATLTPYGNASAIRMEAVSTTYNVVEATLLPGATEFTVSGVAYMAGGSIGTLWDGATRATGGDVNFETVEVLSATDDGFNTTVTVVGCLDAHKGANAITFEHFAAPLVAPSVENGFYLNDDPTVTLPAVFIIGAKSPRMEKMTARGSIGHAFRMENCTHTQHKDLKTEHPLDIGSGNGYGATTYKCRNANFERISGDSTRHAIDISDTYGTNRVETVREENAKSTVVVVAHNGFGSGATVRDVKYKTSANARGVANSSQGYNDALRANHPVPLVDIDGVYVTYIGAITDADVNPVYIDTDGDFLSVSSVSITYTDDTETADQDSGSAIVRCFGSYKVAHVENAYANVTTRPLSFDSDTGGAVGHLHVSGLKFEKAGGPCLIKGYDLTVDGVNYGEINSADFVFDIRQGMNVQRHFSIRECRPLSGTITKVSPARNLDVTVLNGHVQPIGDQASNAFTIADLGAIPAIELFNRSVWFRIDSGVGTGTITVTMPDPIVENGHEIRMTVINGRNTISVDAAANSNAFTVAADEAANVMSVGGKWTKISSNTV